MLYDQYIALMPPNADSVLSHGFQVHVQTPVKEEDKSCLKKISNIQGLTVHEEGEKIVIYKPMKKS